MSRSPRRLLPALLAVLTLGTLTAAAPALAAPTPLPRLVQSQPSDVIGTYFDDHSISGDNHLAWDVSGTIEPLEVGFKSSLTNRGPGALRICGLPSGTAGWQRSFQVATPTLSTACPAAVPAKTKTGWFRYVVANHSDAVPAYFDRWHLMDFQRFVLVPLPKAAGGPATTAGTVWDTDWGTCLNNGGAMMDCEQSTTAPSLTTGIAPATTKLTQEGAPDAESIAIPGDARAQFPNGKYQIVAISNPYGLIQEAGGAQGSIACTTVTLAGAPNYAPFSATPVAGVPSSCYVPRTLIAALTGPGGRDPMAGAGATTPACPLIPTSGHCWATAPAAGPNPPAKTDITTATAVTKTDVVPVPRATSLKGYLAKAIRHDFGRNISRRRVSCGQVALSGSTCTVSWRTGSGYFSVRMYVRFVTSGRHVSWQYRTDVRKSAGGRKKTIRRTYRTGGTI